MPEPVRRRRRSSASLEGIKAFSRDGQSAGPLHEHLRRLILDGAIPNGASISQVELAERLGVSRTPLREALRMLQAEGLIDAEHKRRARVTSLDVADIDTVYGFRVLLEATGVQLTVRTIDAAKLDELRSSLNEMRKHEADPDPEAWARAHRHFHRALVPEAGKEFARALSTYFERGERFRKMFQSEEIQRGVRLLEDHETILRACEDGDPTTAAALVARHSARAALQLMAQIAPERDPTLVRIALQLFTALGS